MGELEGMLKGQPTEDDENRIIKDCVQIDKAEKLLKLTEALYRESVIAGRKDRRQCRKILDLVLARHLHARIGWREGGNVDWRGNYYDVHEKDHLIYQLHSRLNDYLTHRIR